MRRAFGLVGITEPGDPPTRHEEHISAYCNREQLPALYPIQNRLRRTAKILRGFLAALHLYYGASKSFTHTRAAASASGVSHRPIASRSRSSLTRRRLNSHSPFEVKSP
jgi:hypothetical protein